MNTIKTSAITLLVLLLFFQSYSQEYQIQGQISGNIPEGTTLYLQVLDKNSNTFISIDSTLSKDNHFTFQGQTKAKSLSSITLEEQQHIFVLQKGKIQANIEINKDNQSMFYGSQENQQISTFLSKLKQQTNDIQQYRKKNAIVFEKAVDQQDYRSIDSIQSDFALTWNTYVRDLQDTIDQQIIQDPNSITSAFLVYQQLNSGHMEKQKALSIYKNFSKEIKNSNIGELIFALTQQPASVLQLGELPIALIDQSVFEFQQNDKDLILIHLWASWCQSCSEQLHVLEDFYTKNSQNNIKIISINIDMNPEELQQYLQEHNMPWSHAISTPAIMDFFATKSIPTLYAFDKKGQLIQTNHLQQQSMELLQGELSHK